MTGPTIGARRLPTPTARINWSDPLAQGLRFWSNPMTGLDLVGGKIGAASGGVGRSGKGGIAFTSSTGQVDFGVGPILGATQPWSAAARINYGTKADKWIIGKRDGFSTGNNEFGFGSGSSGDDINIQKSNSFVNFSAVSLAANQDYMLAATADGSTSYAYIDGVQAASSVGDLRSDNSPNPRIGVGRRITEASDGFGSGSIEWVAVWARALSRSEIAELYANPFRFLVW